MTAEARRVYDGLCARHREMEDVPDNLFRFEVLLELINFWEDAPDATMEDYRAFKDAVVVYGPSVRPSARCLA